ncbi:MAG: acylphosphatase [Candidatus Nanoarchaeia archaeon]|nr:acylphosphatase [Candidatus Nanoarchaeia archaeon]MDD5357594.1 acylphosphatase [Candidatus Nanoarchaeia archaeon]MDD5588513.1 acylphosphatase [Candidatus Nanoarchaeia archaeon]
MKKAVRLYVDGTVQGIFFRQFVKDNAERFNIRGFVRNLEDGRVEIFAEGEAENVDRFVESCKKGPKHSQIRNVEVKDEKIQDFKEFKILHI